MPKRHNNTIRKLPPRSKTIKAIPSSTTRIGPIIRMEDPKKTPGVDHVYIKEDTEVKKTTVADIVITTHPIGSNAISVISLDAGQTSI